MYGCPSSSPHQDQCRQTLALERDFCGPDSILISTVKQAQKHVKIQGNAMMESEYRPSKKKRERERETSVSDEDTTSVFVSFFFRRCMRTFRPRHAPTFSGCLPVPYSPPSAVPPALRPVTGQSSRDPHHFGSEGDAYAGTGCASTGPAVHCSPPTVHYSPSGVSAR